MIAIFASEFGIDLLKRASVIGVDGTFQVQGCSEFSHPYCKLSIRESFESAKKLRSKKIYIFMYSAKVFLNADTLYTAKCFVSVEKNNILRKLVNLEEI